ncbi:hypothetical protein WR25_21841 isoform A [Diploscapter pachys]|uniref:GST N-terminal domain-containing protein n=1 Tax=Diploscapter pachys TaxID=2018661 RepID=A0A2A2LQY8_9BILA|nr:hypothetical protein WR25_21841 isoform A [Diploscapter pachys]
MLMLYKAQNDSTLKFHVKSVVESRPPDEFIRAGFRKAPALQITDDEGVAHEDDIVDYLERYAPRREYDDDAEDAVADLFRVFACYIKEANKDERALNTELLRLEKHLMSRGTRFLSADEPRAIDCLILPRLHSLRVAGRALKGYEIPNELQHVYEYLRSGYALQMFRTSAASDQEIILHWDARHPSLSVVQRTNLARQQPRYSFSI